MSNLSRALVPTLSAITLCAAAPAQSASEPFVLPGTKDHLAHLAKHQATLAHLVVAVDRAGRVFLQTTGLSDPTTEIPFQDSCRIPLGSLTGELLRAAFERAAARRKLRWEAPIGDALPDLPEAVRSKAWEGLALKGESVIPNYLRYVPDRKSIRPLADVLREHVFVSAGPPPRARSDSMLRAALMQAALERVEGEAWSKLLRDTARSLGAKGVRADEPMHAVEGVARHDKAGHRTPTWHAEVPASNGATGTARDVVALLRVFLQGKRTPGGTLRDRFVGWTERTAAGRDVRYLRRDLELRGACAEVRVYEKPDLAVFVFANRGQWKEVVTLHERVLADVEGPRAQDAWNTAVGFGGGFGGARPNRVKGTYAGQLELWGKTAPFHVHSMTRSVTLHAPEGTMFSTNLRRIGDQITGSCVVPSLAANGGSQKTEFSLRETDKLAGTVTYRETIRDVGEVERLPYPIEMKTKPEGVKRFPKANAKKR